MTRPDLAEKNRARKGANHPRWKGSNVTERGGRHRAQRSISAPEDMERHHIDGDTSNNETNNISIVTRKSHMKTDGRLQRIVEGNKTGQWRIGKKHSEETKRLLSELAKKRTDLQRNDKGQFVKKLGVHRDFDPTPLLTNEILAREGGSEVGQL